MLKDISIRAMNMSKILCGRNKYCASGMKGSIFAPLQVSHSVMQKRQLMSHKEHYGNFSNGGMVDPKICYNKAQSGMTTPGRGGWPPWEYGYIWFRNPNF